MACGGRSGKTLLLKWSKERQVKVTRAVNKGQMEGDIMSSWPQGMIGVDP